MLTVRFLYAPSRCNPSYLPGFVHAVLLIDDLALGIGKLFLEMQVLPEMCLLDHYPIHDW